MGIHKPIDGDQSKALDMAGKWYSEQSERLGVTVAEVEDAILRGWTGDVLQTWPIARANFPRITGFHPARRSKRAKNLSAESLGF